MAHFKNHQWEVTDFGLVSVMPGAPFAYDIEAKRLGEITERKNGTMYEWPVHMAKKTWIDIEAFIEAFEQAMRIHGDKLSGPVDEKMLRESANYARIVRR